MKIASILFTLVLFLSAGNAGAQMPLVLLDANAATSTDWTTAQSLLRAAVECRKPLVATNAVRAVFRMTNGNLNGDHRLPAALTVFGSLKVASISVFEGDEQVGRSYTVQLTNLTMAAVVRAANLKKDGQRYVRNVKGGHLEAGESQPGTIQLSCILGGYDD